MKLDGDDSKYRGQAPIIGQEVDALCSYKRRMGGRSTSVRPGIDAFDQFVFVQVSNVHPKSAVICPKGSYVRRRRVLVRCMLKKLPLEVAIKKFCHMSVSGSEGVGRPR